jgi:putative ABC transport system permease protein
VRIPLVYSLRSLLRRPATTASTAAGIALVVLTFVGMLAMADGFRSVLVGTGRSDNVTLLRAGSDSELMSVISIPDAATIRAMPDVARTADGRPLATGDVYVVVSRERKAGKGQAHVPVRGVDPEAFLVRDNVRIVAGRSFQPGRPEVIVGRALASRVAGLEIGQIVRFGQEDFTIVGQFTADGSSFESETWGDSRQLMTVFRGDIYESLTFRLADPARFDAVRAAIRADPRFNVDVYRESDFFAGQSEGVTRILRFLAFFVTAIMAVGAIFGAVNTMDALVAYRTREIALLLTLGFRRRNILASFLLEALVIALVGGVIGVLLALPINGIHTSTTNMQSMAEVVFQLRVTPAIVARGLVFAALMGLLGGFLPARRASRQVIALALRGE